MLPFLCLALFLQLPYQHNIYKICNNFGVRYSKKLDANFQDELNIGESS